MISPNTIQQITSRIDIIDIVGEFVKLKKRGTNYLGNLSFSQRKITLLYSIACKGNLQVFWMW